MKNLTKVEVDDKGNVTITYPDESTDIIPSDKVVEQKEEIDRSELQTEVDKVDTTKESDKYKNADQDKKDAYDKALEDAKKVLEDPNASQEDVNKAKDALTSAEEALNGEKTPEVDKSALQKEVDKENTTKDTDKYKNADQDKKDAYDKALEDAKKVLENPNASQDDVNKAKKALEDAEKLLNGEAVDKAPLQKEVAKENTTKDTDKYKNAGQDKKDEYDKALEDAKKVLEDPNASQADVNKAKDILKAAEEALNGEKTPEVDKKALQEEVDKDPTTKEDVKYTNASDEKKTAYDEALTKANEVLADENATQEQVDAAKQALIDAREALDGEATPEVDKKALQDEVDKEKSTKDTDKYKNADQDKKNAYDKALADAKKVLADPNASQDDVNKAKQALADAEKALNGEKTPEVDKKALQDEADKEKSTKDTDKYKNADQDKKAAYDKALEDAKKVLEDPNASQADVDKAKDALTSAEEALNGKAIKDADKISPNLPENTEVGNKEKLTEEEKSKIADKIIKANKDSFPEGTKVDVDNKGNATITYPDGSKDIIPAEKLVSEKSKA
ncbi:MAG: hypothetical protein E6Y06_09250, partial [Finegoldia magna]